MSRSAADLMAMNEEPCRAALAHANVETLTRVLNLDPRPTVRATAEPLLVARLKRRALFARGWRNWIRFGAKEELADPDAQAGWDWAARTNELGGMRPHGGRGWRMGRGMGI